MNGFETNAFVDKKCQCAIALNLRNLSFLLSEVKSILRKILTGTLFSGDWFSKL